MKLFKLLIVALLFAGCSKTGQQESYLNIQKIPFSIDHPAGEPNLSKTIEGKIILTWIEENENEHLLKLATLDNNQWGTSEVVASGNNWFVNWADFPSLLSLKEGSVAHYLAYSANEKYAYGVQLTARSNGEHWSESFAPHDDNTPTEHGFVSMAPMNESQFMVIWLDGRKYAQEDSLSMKEMTLRSGIFDLNGTKISEAIIDERTCDCCQTDLVITSKGPVVVYRDRSGMEIRDIYFSRYENNTWTKPRNVSSDEWEIPGCPVNGPAIATNSKYLAIAWFTGAKGIPKVKVIFSEDGGDSFSNPVQVDLGNPLGRVDIAIIDNFAIVTWMEEKENIASIYARRITKDGLLDKPVLVYETDNSRASGFPRMISDGRELVFAWTQPGEHSKIMTAKGVLSD